MTHQRHRHRGYLIVYLGLHGWGIKKDGFHIGYALTAEKAKREIDLIAA